MHAKAPEGEEAWTFVKGPRPTSTRAEVFALLLSLFPDGPMTLCIDNKTVCSRARWLRFKCHAR
eukprot:2859879-Alexandrium_andersonii.AAC.1